MPTGKYHRTNAAQQRVGRCEVCGVEFSYKFYVISGERTICSRPCARRKSQVSHSSLPKSFEALYDLYWNQNLTTVEIAEKYGINHRSVLTQMEKYGVPRRRMGPRQRSSCIVGECDQPPFKIIHSINGSAYGRRCLLHYVAHRKTLARKYWDAVERWVRLGLPRGMSVEVAIGNAVPAGLPRDVAEEVIQELAFQVMAKRSTYNSLRDDARALISHFFREYHDKFRHVSLDAPIGDGSMTLRDLLDEQGRLGVSQP